MQVVNSVASGAQSLLLGMSSSQSWALPLVFLPLLYDGTHTGHLPSSDRKRVVMCQMHVGWSQEIAGKHREEKKKTNLQKDVVGWIRSMRVALILSCLAKSSFSVRKGLFLQSFPCALPWGQQC